MEPARVACDRLKHCGRRRDCDAFDIGVALITLRALERRGRRVAIFENDVKTVRGADLLPLPHTDHRPDGQMIGPADFMEARKSAGAGNQRRLNLIEVLISNRHARADDHANAPAFARRAAIFIANGAPLNRNNVGARWRKRRSHPPFKNIAALLGVEADCRRRQLFSRSCRLAERRDRKDIAHGRKGRPQSRHALFTCAR